MSLDDVALMLLDGATGTELGRRGVDLSPPLWSARALLEAPETLAAVHRDYLEAGADAITTCTFRTHRRSLEKAGMGERAGELTRRAVEIARQVRDETKPGALVLGSVAPLEACYDPTLAPRAAACAAEHEAMMRDLLEAGVDALLIETMGTQREVAAAIESAKALAPGKWMISLLTTSDGPPGTLLSGESVLDLAPMLAEARAAGVNCVAAPAVHAQVALLRRMLPEAVRILAYANVGEPEPGDTWKETEAVDPAHYATLAATWVQAGASIVGGCCGTTPMTIRAIAQRLGK